jgi:hypothetical protein
MIDREGGVMDIDQIQTRLLDSYGIRVEPEMCRYIIRQLEQAGRALRELPVIGGDARTGVPLRVMVDPGRLLAAR